MSRVYECVGRYAQTAYTIKNTMIRVWCLEELCYYICEHAVLLDESFAAPDLMDWLAEECGLKELARQLKVTRRQSMKLETFVLEILDAANYADENEKKEIARVIRANRDMPTLERSMVLAEYFLREGHYIQALNLYDELERTEAGKLGAQKRAMILLNRGVVYARMFYYEDAAEYFKSSYETGGGEIALFSYLAAKRMQLKDGEYLAFLSTLPEDYKETAEVEQELEKLRRQFGESAQNNRQKELRQLKATGKSPEFEQMTQRVLEEEKARYRRFLAE
ncbi:MAG: hypothetical protein J6N53_01580 [Lachnospiraceae bacterium]|nr:hypothetical protein [Lachnospiraceae bacterium]